MFLKLLGILSASRKRQLAGIFILMFIGAFAEMMTLGAVVPFIAVMTDVNALQNYQVFRVVEEYLGHHDADALKFYVASAFALIAIVTGCVRVLLTWAAHAFVYGVGNDIATKTYENLLHRPYEFHIRTNSSKIVGSFNNIQLLIENVFFYVMRASVSLVIAAFIIAALIFIAPGVVLLTIAGFGAIFVAIRLVSGRFLKQNSHIIAQVQSQRIQAILEGIGGIRDIIIGRTQKIFTAKFHGLDRRYQGAHALNESISRMPRIIVEALGMAAIAFVALMLTNQSGGVAALPILGALALGAQRLLPLFQDIFEAWAHSTGYRDVVHEVLDHLKVAEPEQSETPARRKQKFERDISLENLSFEYAAGDKPVLDKVNLKIPKGAVIGVIGETGSGKSSLTDIILGLLEPTSGAIKIDGREIKHETLTNWHDQIAHVPQSVFLQDTSIAQNVAFGTSPEEIDYARVADAVKRAKLDKFVASLPEGLETEVGDRGARLSGGQIQRIGIARALYKGADILVFDEATSALDAQTEAGVMSAIRGIARDRTILIVAHRISTLSNCDMIIEIRNGKIIERDPSHLGSMATQDARSAVVREKVAG